MTKCESCGLVQKPGLRCARCNAVLSRPDLALASAPAQPVPGAPPPLQREIPIDRRAAQREAAPAPAPRLPVPPHPAPNPVAASLRPPVQPQPQLPRSQPQPVLPRPPTGPVSAPNTARPPSARPPPPPAPVAARPATQPTPAAVPPPPPPAPIAAAPAPVAASTPAAPPEVEIIRASPASIFKRLGAWVIDAALIGLVLVGYLKIAQALMHHPPPLTNTTGLDWLVNRIDAYQGIIKYGVFLGAVIGFAYSALFHALGGRTPGERLFGIRLVDRTGRAPSLGRSVVRSLLSVVSFFLLLLGFFMAFFDRRRQALHDKLTATFVVKPLPGS